MIRCRMFASVGDVMRADSGITVVRNLGPWTLQCIDAALKPLFQEADVSTVSEEDILEWSLEQVLRALASGQHWFDVPMSQRGTIATSVGGDDVSTLELSPEAMRWLQRKGLSTVGDLLTAELGYRSLGLAVSEVRKLDEALATFMRSISSTFGLAGDWSLSRAALLQLENPHVSLWQLGWPRSLRGLLSGCEVTHLDQLMGMSADELMHGCGLGRSGIAEVMTRTDDAVAFLSGETQDWPRYWRASGLAIRPERSTETVAEMARRTIELVVGEMGDHRIWTVLSHRYGFFGGVSYTLQEVGDALGVTRERVRQLQVKGVDTLSSWLAHPAELKSGERVWPDVVEAMLELKALCRSIRDQPLAEHDFARRANMALGSSESTLDPGAALVCAAQGVRRIRPKRPMEPVYVGRDEDTAVLKATMAAVHDALTDRHVLAVTDMELTVDINRRRSAPEKLTIDTVVRTLKCVSTVEEVSDGRYRCRFEYLRPRVRQVERVLAHRGDAMDVEEIVREMNRQLVATGNAPVRRPNVINQMARSDRFTAIGRSGLWALSAWPNVESGTVLELLERCLVEAGEAQTASEINRYVTARRPASMASVQLYLAADDRFVRVRGRKWALSSWREARGGARWDRLGVATFVDEHFRHRGEASLPYTDVRGALMAATGFDSKVVTGMLATNPVISTERDGAGVLVAVLQPDYRATIEASARRGPQGAVFKRLASKVETVLKAAPGGELPLRDLRDRVLAEEPATPTSTFYGYVRRMVNVETVALPDRPGKLARLIRTD